MMKHSLIRNCFYIQAEIFASRHKSKARITSARSRNIRVRELGVIKREFCLWTRPLFSAFLKKAKISLEFHARLKFYHLLQEIHNPVFPSHRKFHIHQLKSCYSYSIRMLSHLTRGSLSIKKGKLSPSSSQGSGIPQCGQKTPFPGEWLGFLGTHCGCACREGRLSAPFLNRTLHY